MRANSVVHDDGGRRVGGREGAGSGHWAERVAMRGCRIAVNLVWGRYGR